jgi:osmotically-inducible protein OsmY
MKTRLLALLTLTLALPVFASGCASKKPPASTGAALDDATITTRVKTVLVNDSAIKVARIDVETFKGVVTLSGRVDSKDEEARAIALARTVKGVTGVKSTLQIGPAPRSIADGQLGER